MKLKNLFSLALTALLLAVPVKAQTTVPWLTRSGNNARTGWNSQETILNQQNVGSKGIIRRTIIPFAGDARGGEAQPLILPNVQTATRGVRDVMVLPSMANVVRGVDAHDGSAIWQTAPLGMPITNSPVIDSHMINQHWGCLSTGVIDPDTQQLYQVCWVSPDGSGTPQTARFYMFVLSMVDGSQVVPPVLLQGTSGTQVFNAEMRKQRASLVETNVNGIKTVFVCSGTVYETAPGAAGYCFAYDVASNTLSTMLALTAGEGAGVWMGGQGPAADAQGNLYLVTGNGNFDGVSQWGESFLRLAYTPGVFSNGNFTTPGSLTVADHWTPWDDLQRAPTPPSAKKRAAKLAGWSAPSEAMRAVGAGMEKPLNPAKVVASVDRKGNLTLVVYPQMASGPWSDQDWGSGGPACIFQIGVCVVCGKDGICYPIKAANMGGTTLADLANPKANCAKLAALPVWGTMDPGAFDPCPTNAATLNFFPWGDSAHLHMTPVQMYDPLLKSWTLFIWGENQQLHKWAVSSTGQMTYVAQSHEYASADVRNTPPGGMTGGFCAGSSNGSDPNSALLACVVPYGDANTTVGQGDPGRLLVYDPIHLAADGYLKVLWDSQWFGSQNPTSGVYFWFNKFNQPLIDAGQVYVPNYNGGVDVYQLTP